jgi:hypothetical protein
MTDTVALQILEELKKLNQHLSEIAHQIRVRT